MINLDALKAAGLNSDAVSRSALRLRFAAIKAHYASRAHCVGASASEWGIDAYAWDDTRSGIFLTPIELALWHDIRAENAVMYPQYPVGPFFVDFGNPAAKVAIECDGKRWHIDKKKDAARDRELNLMGWTVYRITGRDCISDTEEVEDEDDELTVTLSPARRFVQMVCDRHPIRRIGSNHGPVHISDAMDRMVVRWAAAA